MEFCLKNKYIKCHISSLGAQLLDLYDADNLNRLHDGNEAYWKGRSPILFPFISRFINGEYMYQGKTYKIGTHGFAKLKEFQLISYKENELILMLEDDEETLSVYPFHFQFLVRFSLKENQLLVDFEVLNVDEKKMYFMLGGHPGFKTPLYENEQYSDYQLVFENLENAKKNVLDGNFLSNVYEPFLHDEKVIPLQYKMFNPDAYVLQGLTSHYVDLMSKNHNKKIRFYFHDFQILAIWSTLNVDSPFVCLEPWNGLRKEIVPDLEKMGILELEPREQYTCGYTIEVIN